mmetsp:Transcript_22677/g.33774  ORF Transcript_22677/g.33774 Transcript_22677/m.33774 type:complete len:428 (-) Transcript_22677:169-1452(-)
MVSEDAINEPLIAEGYKDPNGNGRSDDTSWSQGLAPPDRTEPDENKSVNRNVSAGHNTGSLDFRDSLTRPSIEHFSTMTFESFKDYVQTNSSIILKSREGITSMKHSTWGNTNEPTHCCSPIFAFLVFINLTAIGAAVAVSKTHHWEAATIAIVVSSFAFFLLLVTSITTYMLIYKGGLDKARNACFLSFFGARCNIWANQFCRYLLLCCYNPCEFQILDLVMNDEARQTAKRIMKLNEGKGPDPGGVCWLGDSEFTFWHNLREDMKPFHPNNFNAGFGGSRVCDIARNIDIVCFDFDPETVILHAAGNDFDFAFKTLTIEALKVRLMDLFRAIDSHPSVKRIGYFLSSRRPTYTDEKWDFMIRVHAFMIEAIEESELKDRVKVFDLRYMVHPLDDFYHDRSHLNDQGHGRKAKELLRLLQETWPPA